MMQAARGHWRGHTRFHLFLSVLVFPPLSCGRHHVPLRDVRKFWVVRGPLRLTVWIRIQACTKSPLTTNPLSLACLSVWS